MGEIKPVSEITAQVCHEEGVEHAFGVTGYHAEYNISLMPALFGTKMHQMRHEQSAAYAADGYIGVSRKPAVIWGTAGPGVTNMISGIAQMLTAQRPCVVFAGNHGPLVDRHWSLQEAKVADMLKPVTKETVVIRDRRTLPYDVRRAFRIAKAAPQGPVAIVTDPALARPIDTDSLSWWIEREQCARVSPPAGDPAEIEKIVDWILKAERPVIVAGDGVYWSKADAEVREFVNLLQIPFNGRRTAAGMIPETDPLGVASGWRGRTMTDADLILLIGLREGATEGNMYAPGLGVYRRDVKYIQINESVSEVAEFLPTLSMLIASPKLALRQIINCAKDRLGGKKIDRSAWLDTVNKHKLSFWANVEKNAANDKTGPVGGHIFGKEFGSFCNDLGSYVLVQDSFSGSSATAAKCIAVEPGTALDAAGWSGCGHGMPMAFGAKLARPDLPCISLSGDLGIGITNMEFETLVREKVPVVTVVYNNSEYIAGGHKYLYGKGKALVDNKLTQDFRYDLMYKDMGVHGEFVTEAAQLRPALHRAVESGKPAIVNVITDPGYMHPWGPGLLLGGQLTMMGAEYCKKIGIYDDSFWTDIIAKNAGAQKKREEGGTQEEIIEAGIQYQVNLHMALGDMFGC